MPPERVKVPTRGRPSREETPPRAKAKPPETPDPPDTAAGQGPGTRTDARSTARPSAPNTKASRMDAQIRDSLLNLYGTIGLAIGGIGSINENAVMVAAGVNVTVQAPVVVDTWLELGTQVPAVRKALESMLTGSAIATIAMQHVGMIAPVLWAFGLIPGQMGEVFLAPEARAAGEAFTTTRATAHAATNGHGTEPSA